MLCFFVEESWEEWAWHASNFYGKRERQLIATITQHAQGNDIDFSVAILQVVLSLRLWKNQPDPNKIPHARGV
jgi:hypothetical protein